MTFYEKLQESLKQGIDLSAEWLVKARDVAGDVEETTMIRLQIKRLEKERSERLAALGEKVYTILSSGEQKSVSLKTDKIKALLQELQDIEQLRDEKERELEKNK